MRSIPGSRAAIGVLVCGVLTVSCSGSPTGPSQAASMAAAAPGAAVQSASQEGGVSAEDLQARGWDCRPVPGRPTLSACSPPNQAHPALIPGPPPPDDRPATINLLIFDNGAFVGHNSMIRSDLYHGQPCRSTGGDYRFIARIGYYECLHPPGGS